ncbi:MAG: hypothetical protein JF609_06230, partial [Verrucomicrobia bacterium]|nr:hypothetical protein [Verrucomicrobiota bacterium]
MMSSRKLPGRFLNPLVILALLALWSSLALAELPPLIPRALLFENPEYSSPLISPDGMQIAFLKADTNRVMQVWVRDISGGHPRQLTHEMRRGVNSENLSWAYNGKLLYLKDQAGDELEHLFICYPANGDVRDLTPFPGSKAVLIGCEAAKPAEVLITLNRQGKAAFDVWSVNL